MGIKAASQPAVPASGIQQKIELGRFRHRNKQTLNHVLSSKYTIKTGNIETRKIHLKKYQACDM